VPVLMVCSSGVSIFMSTLVQNNLALRIFTPLLNTALEFAPLVLAWLAFTLSYFLIPNTKVQFKYAAIAGAICAVAFQILQLLFVNGQIYVSKYNAIYGSFAFLPLLLIWLQLSWLILLFGCVLSYSLQNIFAFNFLGDVTTISADYRRKIVLVVTTAIYSRFEQKLPPLTRNDLSTLYDIPIRMVGDITYALHKAGLIYFVVLNEQEQGFAPAVDADSLTVGELFRRLDAQGDSDFIPRFNEIYPEIVSSMDALNREAWQRADAVRVIDVKLPSPEKIRAVLSQYKIKIDSDHLASYGDAAPGGASQPAGESAPQPTGRQNHAQDTHTTAQMPEARASAPSQSKPTKKEGKW
jgi:membrane protein